MSKLSHPFIVELKRFVANQNATLGPLVMSLSELISMKKSTYFNSHRNDNSTDCSQEQKKQRKLSEVTDMIHAAHVFHRCVRNNTCHSALSATSKRLHQDNILSLLVGDYLLAQSSVDMADLRCPRAVGLIARGLEDYTRGEFLKLQLFDQYQAPDSRMESSTISDVLEKYAQLTCGSLLSNAFLSAALLAGYPDFDIDSKQKIEKTDTLNLRNLSHFVHAFGFHTGSAHRLIEILYCPDTNSETDQAFIQKLDVNLFKKSIHDHIQKSTNLLLKFPDCDKRQSLMRFLEDMSDRC